MDLSYSMKDDLENVKSLGTDLMNEMKRITSDFRIGGNIEKINNFHLYKPWQFYFSLYTCEIKRWSFSFFFQRGLISLVTYLIISPCPCFSVVCATMLLDTDYCCPLYPQGISSTPSADTKIHRYSSPFYRICAFRQQQGLPTHHFIHMDSS